MRSATARTSRSLWVMKTIDVPSSRSWRMIAMSSSVSCGVSTAVGSSKTSTLRVARERLDDLDALLDADGQIADDGVGVDLEAEAVGDVAHVLTGLGEVERARALLVSSCPSMTFSATVKTGMSMKCWCTMPMPAAMASPGPRKCWTASSRRISPSSAWYRP